MLLIPLKIFVPVSFNVSNAAKLSVGTQITKINTAKKTNVSILLSPNIIIPSNWLLCLVYHKYQNFSTKKSISLKHLTFCLYYIFIFCNKKFTVRGALPSLIKLSPLAWVCERYRNIFLVDATYFKAHLHHFYLLLLYCFFSLPYIWCYFFVIF